MEIEKYQLELDLNYKNLEYRGHEIITVSGNKEKFFLNSVDLSIESIVSHGKTFKFKENKKKQTIETDLILSGKTEVEVKFSGKVSKGLEGLYVADYKNGRMITTQFESTGARHAFPCVDDPSKKAVFSLTLTIDNELDAISNMPIKSSEINRGRKVVVFEDTPRMSTYLLYIGIGTFDSIEKQSGPLKIILTAPKGLLNSTDFPAAEAADIIAKYEEYYGIKFMLPKMHLISVPEFAAGAMENWGAITFRETALLVNDSTTTAGRQRASEVVAHEIAHQWFGDLVTMEWWDDLWLNESFATFMAFKFVDQLHQKWLFTGKFLVDETAGALYGDALVNSHPIQAHVKNPDDISQIFDEISYGKGASVLRMIENYVSPDKFRDGIRKYLKEHSYGNAKGEYLWKAIQDVSGLPVSKIMGSWIKKVGYPLVTAELVGKEIRLSQERFLLNKKVKEQPRTIPLTVLRENGKENVLFSRSEMRIKAEGFLKLNYEQSGFYRVAYKGKLLKDVIGRSKNFGYLDRWGIVNDTFALLEAGKIKLKDYLDTIERFLDEDNYIVNTEICQQLSLLNFVDEKNRKVKNLAMKFYKAQLKRLGEAKKEGESENDSILRGTVSANLSILDKDFAKKISKSFNKFFKSDTDLRRAIAIGYARNSNDLDAFIKFLKQSKTDADRTTLIAGMSFLGRKSYFNKFVSMVGKGDIKKQDSISLFIMLSRNKVMRESLLDSLEDVVNTMEEFFSGTGYTYRFLEAVIPFIGLDYEKKLKNKLQKIRKPAYSHGIDKGLETLQIYSRLKKLMSKA
jgi:tricorn protease interacting factor F2/3